MLCKVLPYLIDQLAYLLTRGMIRIRPIGDVASKVQEFSIYRQSDRHASNPPSSEHLRGGALLYCGSTVGRAWAIL